MHAGEGEKRKKFQDKHQLGCATKSRNCTEGTFKSPILALRHPWTRGEGEGHELLKKIVMVGQRRILASCKFSSGEGLGLRLLTTSCGGYYCMARLDYHLVCQLVLVHAGNCAGGEDDVSSGVKLQWDLGRTIDKVGDCLGDHLDVYF